MTGYMPSRRSRSFALLVVVVVVLVFPPSPWFALLILIPLGILLYWSNR